MNKKTLLFDAEACVGCYACAVACMDQNDIDVIGDQLAYRHVMHVERVHDGETRITHVSLACQHCEGAECLDACPSRALRRDVATGAVLVRRELCIGCHACIDQIGCPAISMKNGKAVVDQTQCVGCGVCSQLCPKGAFSC